MNKTIEELIKEIMSDENLQKELIAIMSEPAKIPAFLKDHGCSENVNDFIKRLDSFN